jgi:hypothetical protein
MKKRYVSLLIIGLILLFAALTNPRTERHKEVIKTKLKAYMQKSMKESMTDTKDDWEQFGQALGMMVGTAIIEPIIDNLVSTDNYILFSTTKITWDGETRVIGIGAFGNVFITKELDNALNQGLLDNNEQN